MVKLKSCPRCKKDTVTFDRDQYGWYAYCILCGYLLDLSSLAELRQQQACDRRGEKGLGL